MTNLYIDLHLLQTVPPSNINRDDTGSPKTAIYGGVRRARVSSQAWKRATREHFSETLDTTDLGVRTKRLVEVVSERIIALAPDITPDAAASGAAEVLKAAKIKIAKPTKDAPHEEASYLIFLANNQVDALSELAIEFLRDDVKINSRAAQAITENNSIDLSLFGRMVADVPGFNVDAAAQVAHAISIHKVDNEFDYFTAVDDKKAADSDSDAGAGMIGTVEFNSSTLYRYATINVKQLQHNLADPSATRRAVEGFIRSFVTSLPTGKQNTFANRTLPEVIVATVRTDQPINFVGAFEEPLNAITDRAQLAAKSLTQYATGVADAYGQAPVAAFVTAIGNRAEELRPVGTVVPFPTLLQEVGTLVTDFLADKD